MHLKLYSEALCTTQWLICTMIFFFLHHPHITVYMQCKHLSHYTFLIISHNHMLFNCVSNSSFDIYSNFQLLLCQETNCNYSYSLSDFCVRFTQSFGFRLLQ